MASVMLLPNPTRMGPARLTVNNGRTRVIERNVVQILSEEELSALENSYEADYVRVIDRAATEPTPEMLPPVDAQSPEPPPSKVSEVAEAFGRAKARQDKP